MAEIAERPVSRVVRARRLVAKALVVELLVLCIIGSVYWSHPRGDVLLDFGSFVASAQAAAEGSNPYGVYPLTFRPYFWRVGVVETPNLNPPISVLLFRPLADLEPTDAFRAWYLISLALYLGILWLLACAYRQQRNHLRILWALSLASLWHTLQLGQIYVPLLLATTGAWLLLCEERYVAAGVLIGVLVAIKPNFALWPLLLLVAGYWQVALAALGCAAALSLVPVFVYGPGIYEQWLAAAGAFSGASLPGNSSLPGLMARLGLPGLGPVLAAIVVLGAAVLAWRRRPSIMDVSGLAIVTSLLASPIAWLGYTLLLLPVLFGRSWSPLLRAAAAILVFPFAVVVRWFQVSEWLFVILGSIYTGSLLLMLAALVRETAAGPPAHQGTP